MAQGNYIDSTFVKNTAYLHTTMAPTDIQKIVVTKPETNIMVFPKDTEYSGDIFEKQKAELPEEEEEEQTNNHNFLFTASDRKQYSIEECISMRLNNAYEEASKKRESLSFIGRVLEFFHIREPFKNFDKAYEKNYEIFNSYYESNDINGLFYNMTGIEFSNENVEKFLKGGIKLKAEHAAEKYTKKELKYYPAQPHVSKYYVNENNLADRKNSRTELDEAEQEKYETIKNSVSPKYQSKLENALRNGQLLQTDSDDKITVLESLYKILTTPRAEKLGGKQILEECIEILDNPYIITQIAEDIPEEYHEECVDRLVAHEIRKSEKRVENYNNSVACLDAQYADKINKITMKGIIPGSENLIPTPNPISPPQVMTEECARYFIIEPIREEVLNYRNIGTCAATSIEYYLAAEHPARFFKMVEALSSEKKCFVKNVILEKQVSDFQTTWWLDMFNTEYKMLDENNAEVIIKADENAYLLAEIQMKYKDEGERSITDILMQSAIMNLGSRNTYEAISDKREPNEWTQENSGLIQIENEFVLNIITEDKLYGKTYKSIDNKGFIRETSNSYDIKNEILKAINERGSVVTGLIYSCDGHIEGGHEITIIGYTTNLNGEGFFIIQDSDDWESKPVMMPEDILIKQLHHAFI